MSAQNPDVIEEHAVAQLKSALESVFGAGGPLEGKMGFALFLVRKQEPGAAACSAAMISDTPRDRVAEAVAGWLVAKGYASLIPVKSN